MGKSYPRTTFEGNLGEDGERHLAGREMWAERLHPREEETGSKRRTSKKGSKTVKEQGANVLVKRGESAPREGRKGRG